MVLRLLALQAWELGCVGRNVCTAVTGLAVVLQASEMLFFLIKLTGARSLFYLAAQLWRAPSTPAALSCAAKQPLRPLLKQAFLVAAGKPETIVIFSTFLPHFIGIEQAAAPQLGPRWQVQSCGWHTPGRLR
ncbi:LysE family translocator [Lampropedia aestuarii]|uniref:LysE family translocator n=1 Tax=Lampropedia aestuarii TaxID=2562762 RepID=UPI0024684DBD|nr:LysE family transporter [Lampropedia aestuarii]MDH5858281.1 LysE family transporter [Lampropedia aestuarii]